MARPTILTPTALARVRALVNQGMSAAAIADELGCTLGTLRVKCSQLGISLRRRTLEGRERPEALLSYASRSAAPRCRPAELVTPPLGRGALGSGPRVALSIVVPQLTADQLLHRAALSGVSRATLAAELLSTVTRDNLYDAVLDDG
jgi:Helix-turn-helix domain of resolvase